MSKSTIDHAYTLMLLNKIYDLSNNSRELKDKLRVSWVNWSGNGNRSIKTNFIKFTFNVLQEFLKIELNDVELYNEGEHYNERFIETRTEKETCLILKQIQDFEEVYNRHLDEQSKELCITAIPEESVSLEKFSVEEADIVCQKKIAASAEIKWFLSFGCGVLVFIGGTLVKLPLFVTSCLVIMTYFLWLGHHVHEEKKQIAICEKRKKDAPPKMIEESEDDDEFTAKNKELDRKNDAVDAVMKALSDM